MENNENITLEYIINMNKEHSHLLYKYFFHFNHHKGELGEWHAIPGDQLKYYLNGTAKGVITSDINDLQDIVDKIIAL